MLDQKYFIKKSFNDETVLSLKNRLEEIIKEYGFGVLAQIDVKETMKKKINKDYDEFLILGLCNPNFADSILSQNKDFAIFLPCNALIYKEAGVVQLVLVNPEAMLPHELQESEEFKTLASKVKGIFEEIVNKL